MWLNVCEKENNKNLSLPAKEEQMPLSLTVSPKQKQTNKLFTVTSPIPVKMESILWSIKHLLLHIDGQT